jgi:3-oxoacyl-[acyl-carrier-protein] synthase III
VRRIGLEATASYLPERWMTAGEIAARSAIPEAVVVEKFGLRGKHIAAPNEHVSDLSVKAGERLFEETGFDPANVDAVMYYGSMWKDWSIWQVAPWIAHRLGCTNAFAVEFDNASHGTSIALRLARDILRAEPELTSLLMVAAARESELLDYENERSRFAFNFGDGAAAGLLVADGGRNEVLGAHAVTDGSYSLHVKVPGGGSRDRNGGGYRFLDVADGALMKERLDRDSLRNFVRASEVALERSGASLDELSFVCPLHMKRSMSLALLDALGVAAERSIYLDDTGHMSGVDPLLGLDRAARTGLLADGDVVLLVSAGTGYTWAASVVRWGPFA